MFLLPGVISGRGINGEAVPATCVYTDDTFWSPIGLTTWNAPEFRWENSSFDQVTLTPLGGWPVSLGQPSEIVITMDHGDSSNVWALFGEVEDSNGDYLAGVFDDTTDNDIKQYTITLDWTGSDPGAVIGDIVFYYLDDSGNDTGGVAPMITCIDFNA